MPADLIAPLLALAEAGIDPDLQELLVHGNSARGIPPGALAKAIAAAATNSGLVSAIEPFACAEFEAPVADEHGWTDFGISWARERICDWFGPSQFRHAAETYRALTGRTREAGTDAAWRDPARLLEWHIPENLRWLANQPDRPDRVPCGMLTGQFLLQVADRLEALAAERFKQASGAVDVSRSTDRPTAGGSPERLAEALKPFAAMRLSTEGTVSDLVWRTPAAEMRRQASAIEQRDAEILAAREALQAMERTDG